MTEGTYEYECMRAELLGLEKPDYEEFMKNRKEREARQIEEESLDTEALKALDSEKEQMKGITGGLDELNSILKKTQLKITRFKASCGSLTNLLKIKVAGKSGSQTSLNVDQQPESVMSDTPTNSSAVNDSQDLRNSEEEALEDARAVRKSDLAKALDKDLSALDRMIEKAESAQYSMEYQRKEMNKFLH